MRVAFGFQSRVGKDTAGAFLQKEYGGTILNFAGALYSILHYAQDICGFTRKKDVKFLQWIGTEWARHQNSEVWVDTLVRKIPEDTTENVYVTDVRYTNELERLKEAGFTLVKIVRPDRPIDRDTTHSSETELANYTGWDYTIVNDEDLKTFYKKLKNLAQELHS